MPIFRFVAVTGTILLALLFWADAALKPRGPLFTNNSEGLTRSEPVRTQTAQRAPEIQRPRAPALVPVTPPQPIAKPAAPPIAEIAETVETPPVPARAEVATSEPAKPEVATSESTKTEPIKTEPAKTEPAKLETATLEAAATEPAKTEVIKRDAVTAAPKARKQATRKTERGNRYAAYRDNRDDVPTIDNGYAYGVPMRRERSDWQRSWDGYGQNRFRF